MRCMTAQIFYRFKRGAPAFIALLVVALCSAPGSAPVGAAEASNRGPDVVIIAQEERVIYEFRQGGELRMVRVVPKWGKPYYLVPANPTEGFGNLERAEMLVAQWVIAEF